MTRISLAFAAVMTMALSGPALGKSEKAKDGKPAHVEKSLKSKTGGESTSDSISAAAAAGATLAGILLSDADRATIAKYFETHPDPEPAKRLPPGIAKNVARGKPIPPGIAKRGVPADLSRQLTIPKGYDLERVGTDVVLIEAGTRIIADILKDVLTK